MCTSLHSYLEMQILVHVRRVWVCSNEEADCLGFKNTVVEASGYSTSSQHAAASLQNHGLHKNPEIPDKDLCPSSFQRVSVQLGLCNISATHWFFLKVCRCYLQLGSSHRYFPLPLTMAYHSRSVFLVLPPTLPKLTNVISTRDILSYKEQLFFH